MIYTFTLDTEAPLLAKVLVTTEDGEVVGELPISNNMSRGFNLMRLERWMGSVNLRELLHQHVAVTIEVEEPLKL